MTGAQAAYKFKVALEDWIVKNPEQNFQGHISKWNVVEGLEGSIVQGHIFGPRLSSTRNVLSEIAKLAQESFRQEKRDGYRELDQLFRFRYVDDFNGSHLIGFEQYTNVRNVTILYLLTNFTINGHNYYYGLSAERFY